MTTVHPDQKLPLERWFEKFKVSNIFIRETFHKDIVAGNFLQAAKESGWEEKVKKYHKECGGAKRKMFNFPLK